jgi:predicted transcriptional regulator
LSIVTPKLFEEMLDENISAMQSAKGRHTIEINSFSLREKRQELGYTLKQLADMVDISKKCLYEIESKRVNPTDETVRKLEARLHIKLRMPFEMKRSEVKYLKPKNEFQDRVSKEFVRIGVDNSAVYSAPFEIVGKEEEVPLITGLTRNIVEIRKEAGFVKELSHIVSSQAVFISKKSEEKSIQGIPIVLEKELPEIETSKEFEELLLEKEE